MVYIERKKDKCPMQTNSKIETEWNLAIREKEIGREGSYRMVDKSIHKLKTMWRNSG